MKHFAFIASLMPGMSLLAAVDEVNSCFTVSRAAAPAGRTGLCNKFRFPPEPHSARRTPESGGGEKTCGSDGDSAQTPVQFKAIRNQLIKLILEK